MVVRRGAAHAALQQLARNVPRKTTLPSVKYASLVANGSALSIRVSDGGTTHITATMPCAGRLSTCLRIDQLTDIVRPFGPEERAGLVEFVPGDQGKVDVAVEAAMASLTPLPPGEFPPRPGDQHVPGSWRMAGRWPAADFASALRWVSLAVGTDETRRNLTGVLFAKDEVVGLDGHRLHLVKMHGLADGSPTLIGGRSIAALLRVLPKSGDVAAHRAGDILRFSCSAGDVSWVVETEAITDVKYPPYDQVIPAVGAETFRTEVDRAALVRGIARMPKAGDRRRAGVRLVVNGAIKIERDTDEGVASTTISVLASTHQGADSIVGLDARYLSDALDTDVPIVVGRFGGPLDAVRFDLGPSRVALVMPMRM